jgi:hypothetical protein
MGFQLLGVADDCVTKLRWFYDRRNVEEGPPVPGRLARQVASKVSQAMRVGGR